MISVKFWHRGGMERHLIVLLMGLFCVVGVSVPLTSWDVIPSEKRTYLKKRVF